MGKDYRKNWFNFLLITSFIIITLMTGTIVYDILRVKNSTNIDEESTDSEEESVDVTDFEYYSAEEVIEKYNELVGQKIVLSGYMCLEYADNMGCVWICSEKFKSKDEVDFLVRLESDEVINYTPCAVMAYGELSLTDEGHAVIMKDPEMYFYGGKDEMVILYNDIIQAGGLDAVATALTYDDDSNVSEQLEIIKTLSQSNFCVNLENTVVNIIELYNKKQDYSKEEFELNAEKLYATYINDLIEMEVQQ